MLLEIQDLHKTYIRGSEHIAALRGVSLEIGTGEFVSIVGPSGSGKSTLMQLCGVLDRPTSGKILMDGQRLDRFSDGQLSAFRRRRLGFVFQFFNLVPTLTAEENVALPLLLDGVRASKVLARVPALLEAVGLTGRAKHRPDQLSGGEQQRVALARALIAEPLLVLADEPTGNLDTETGRGILSLLREQVREHGRTVVMVTHDNQAAAYGTRIVGMRDGALEFNRPVATSAFHDVSTGLGAAAKSAAC